MEMTVKKPIIFDRNAIKNRRMMKDGRQNKHAPFDERMLVLILNSSFPGKNKLGLSVLLIDAKDKEL